MKRNKESIFEWLIEPLIVTARNRRGLSLEREGLGLDDAGKIHTLIVKGGGGNCVVTTDYVHNNMVSRNGVLDLNDARLN